MVRFGQNLAIVLSLGIAGCATYHPMPLDSAAVEQRLALPSAAAMSVRASEIRHPILASVQLDMRQGLSPDQAAVLAVLLNPSLRAERDRQAISATQLLQAGILPNPTLDLTLDPVTGGNTAGTVTGYDVGLGWEVTSLITRSAKMAAARSDAAAVRLDLAWREWQVAQAARKAVYDLVALRAQLGIAEEVDRHLSENLALVRHAVEAHQSTLLDLSAAEAASQKSHADMLRLRGDVRHQELLLKQSLGLPAPAPVDLRKDIALALPFALPSEQELSDGLEQRRLDLLGLRQGYQSQEETLRAAVLSQFPKIVLGFHQASDTTNVHTTGFGVSIDLPVFDRNQGHIAIERATRQRLFDEYISRIYEARLAIAMALADIRSLSEQIAAAEAAIPALERLVQVYREAVDQHNADVLSYYTARNDLAQKRIDLLKLQQQLMENKIALELAAGRYLPEESRAATRPATTEPTR